jgi:hypothetical protein
MMNRLEQFKTDMDRNELRIPLDLSEWVEREALRAWVREEIEALDWGNPQLEAYLQAHPDFRPKDLLTLLSYAYATGVLESEEIILALKNNTDFKELWAEPWPTAKELERFRRQNRALLRWALVRILKRALQSKWQFGDIRFLAGLRALLVDTAAERLDLARHMDRAAQGA